MTLGRVVGEADPAQIEVAEGNIRQGISMTKELNMRPASAICYLYLGELFEMAGCREDAIESLKTAENLGQEMGMIYWLNRTQEALARLET
jgi:hypothetical protein